MTSPQPLPEPGAPRGTPAPTPGPSVGTPAPPGTPGPSSAHPSIALQPESGQAAPPGYVPVGPYPGPYPPQGYAIPPPPGYPPGHGYPPGYGFPPPPPRSPRGQPLAEFGDRLLAYLIDYAILLAASIPILVPVVIAQFSIMMRPLNQFENGGSLEPPPTPGEFFGSIIGPLLGVYAAAFALTLVVYYIYRVEMMFRTGQTVGKRVMKLRVVPLDPGARLTRGMATKRWLVDSVGASFVPLLVYLDGFWQLWDKPYRQCLHDKFAETTVVKVGP